MMNAPDPAAFRSLWARVAARHGTDAEDVRKALCDLISALPEESRQSAGHAAEQMSPEELLCILLKKIRTPET